MIQRAINCLYLLEELKRLRKYKHLSLSKCAYDMSTSSSYISRVERGLTVPSLEFFVKYLRYLGADTINYFNILPF